MTWPPPVLPINRTNATPQMDTHAADHNAVNLAMNDTVVAVNGLAVEVGNHTTGINAIKNPNWIKGVDRRDGSVGFIIASGSTVVTTNAQGDFSIALLAMFTGPPIVLATIGSSTTPNLIITIVAADTQNFSGHCIYANTDAATAAANTPVTVNWVALGPK